MRKTMCGVIAHDRRPLIFAEHLQLYGKGSNIPSVYLMTPSPPLLFQRELEFQRRHDLLHDLVLQGKDVCEGAVVALGPHMGVCGGVH